MTLTTKTWTLHLSKGPSDLEQNRTYEKTPFSGPLFLAFLLVWLVFFPTVGFWNHQIEASHWLVEEFWPKFFPGSNTQDKTDHTTCKGNKNTRTLCLFLGSILFELANPFWKMWSGCKFRLKARACKMTFFINPGLTTHCKDQRSCNRQQNDLIINSRKGGID